jgi:hypothetical protein
VIRKPAPAPERRRGGLLLIWTRGARESLAGTSGPSDPVAIRARSQAEKYYSLLANEYPAYAKLDDALYLLGREYQRGGEREEARRAYLGLLQKYPASKDVPLAYLALGDLFYEEGERDPRLTRERDAVGRIRPATRGRT